mgnify:CR=1 FL=1
MIFNLLILNFLKIFKYKKKKELFIKILKDLNKRKNKLIKREYGFSIYLLFIKNNFQYCSQ